MKQILLLALTTFVLTNCTIQKEAFKKKENTAIASDVVKTEQTKTFDFSTTDTDLDEFKFEPSDVSKYMHIITAKGDTISAKNTSITKSKLKTKRQNQVTENTNKNLTDNTLTETDNLLKAKEKTEDSTKGLLYIVGGIGFIVVALGFFGLFFMYKLLNKNTAAVTSVLDKL